VRCGTAHAHRTPKIVATVASPPGPDARPRAWIYRHLTSNWFLNGGIAANEGERQGQTRRKPATQSSEATVHALGAGHAGRATARPRPGESHVPDHAMVTLHHRACHGRSARVPNRPRRRCRRTCPPKGVTPKAHRFRHRHHRASDPEARFIQIPQGRSVNPNENHACRGGHTRSAPASLVCRRRSRSSSVVLVAGRPRTTDWYRDHGRTVEAKQHDPQHHPSATRPPIPPHA